MKIQQLLSKYAHIGDKSDILLIIEHVLGIRYSRLLAMDYISMDSQQQDKLDKCLSRLSSGEPVQYILGTWDFIDMTLNVDSRALIPRPETEELALLAVDIAKTQSCPSIIDIGCGTGCIGLYIKKAVPSANVTLLDISADAIALAKENANMLDLDVDFLHQDMRSIEHQYDIIVSNPPYIEKGILDSLSDSVVDYEPMNALDGGDDGLTFYKELADMHTHINDGGYLMLEIGYNQKQSVSQLLSEHFTGINVIKDIAQLDRIVVAKKK